MRAACDGAENEVQRVAVGYPDLCKQWDDLRALQCSLVGCEVAVPAEALVALQKAVADLVVSSDGLAVCASWAQVVR